MVVYGSRPERRWFSFFFFFLPHALVMVTQINANFISQQLQLQTSGDQYKIMF